MLAVWTLSYLAVFFIGILFAFLAAYAVTTSDENKELKARMARKEAAEKPEPDSKSNHILKY